MIMIHSSPALYPGDHLSVVINKWKMPSHSSQLAAYCMDVYEVTNADFVTFMG